MGFPCSPILDTRQLVYFVGNWAIPDALCVVIVWCILTEEGN